jgi:NAD(P)-dependent dehydrogenase (short-subunit alcohol dehydrogenase family)
MLLENKSAIVTGGASGIGEEICLRFAEQGATIAIADVNVEGARAVIKKIEACGAKACHVHVDIRDGQKVQDSVTEVLDRFGTVDILVNCAGFNQFVEVDQVPPELWEKVLSVNLEGSWNFCRAVMGQMIRKRSGKIINIGSAAAVLAIPKALPYVVAKHAVVGLTRALAVDLGPYNINVNCICPGPVQTPLLDQTTTPTFRAEITKTIPLNRLGTPSDLAHAAVFLASSLSDWITGVVLPVDGGLVSCVRAHHWE